MPIVAVAGLSYSPLLYRERSQWPKIAEFLRGTAIQPKSASEETDVVLDDFAGRIANAFAMLERGIIDAKLDALILICADRGSQFDPSHVPQLHIQVGGEIWGNPALSQLGETQKRLTFKCEESVADLLIEELVREGFDIAEGRELFVPVGDPGVGITPAACHALERVGAGLPVIPITINCHIAPAISGHRAHRFGQALANVSALTDKRLGVLISGGLSGDPHGRMAGWVDEVFDRWLLRRIERGGSTALARIWDAVSANLLVGSTAEVRLWTVAAAAAEQAGLKATVHDYMPIHAAAAGVAFVSWEL
jgi:hypothetical protein